MNESVIEHSVEYRAIADSIHEIRLSILATETELLDQKDELSYFESVLVLKAEGRNAEERKANLVILCQDDEDFGAAQTKFRSLQHHMGIMQAWLEQEIARQRLLGWLLRGHLMINGPSADDA